MDKDICEICGKETDRLYECSHCETTMCYECIVIDDYCPVCSSQGTIFQV